MRRFFLILLAMSFLALMLAQPSMRQTARSADVSAPDSIGGEGTQHPEIIATNLPEGDTLVGIMPLDPDSLRAWTDSLRTPALLPDQLMSDSIGAAGAETDSITAVETEEFEETDTIENDRTGMTRINREKADLENGVAFSAKDSVVLIGNKLAYFYGNGEVEYGNFKLNADEIKMVMDSTTVYANGRIDSVGELQGKPVFKDGGDTYESKTMSYNFKNQRGYITDIITEQGEGYLTGGRSKKMADGSFFAEDAIYTTCDEHDHPHFYIKLTRGKMRPGKDVVSGAAYMVVADVPLPLALPFGYFPFSKEYSSGIIFPTFGDDYNRGFYMRNGGYDSALSDYVDLALTGEIYT
ncbi:MAG: LPS-assembly protein LptD, partial [Muribaculaceae bacterium]|nr:LPS-assembly protein LptD [Muribaculaceae bacterium]